MHIFSPSNCREHQFTLAVDLAYYYGYLYCDGPPAKADSQCFSKLNSWPVISAEICISGQCQHLILKPLSTNTSDMALLPCIPVNNYWISREKYIKHYFLSKKNMPGLKNAGDPDLFKLNLLLFTHWKTQTVFTFTESSSSVQALHSDMRWVQRDFLPSADEYLKSFLCQTTDASKKAP